MSLVKPYLITLRLFSGGGGQDLRNFTGFRESRPTAGLQVIVPLKLGLKFSYSSDLKHCVVWAEIFL